jgi:flagellar basal-body rod modification protein FlgD
VTDSAAEGFISTVREEREEPMDGIQQMVTSATQTANSAISVANAMAKPKAAATTSTSTTSSDATSASSASTDTISANDFLTLLVAEMKNQDPTQPTDPNQYITQMVDVNSLQQLIGINQGVGTLDTATGADTAASGNATSAIGATE